MFMIIVAYKALTNFINLIRINKLSKVYEDYWVSLMSGNLDSMSDIQENKYILKELILKSGIVEPTLTRVIPKGLGYVQTASGISTLDNMYVNDKEIVGHVFDSIIAAKGIFKQRIWDSFNPIYWIELVIFLPQKLMNYLNFRSSTQSTKIMNVLYWVLTTLLAIFNNDIHDFLINLFNTIVDFF